MQMRIKTKQEVHRLTAVVTVLAVLVPALITFAAFGTSPAGFAASYVAPVFAIAVLIPATILPPIAYLLIETIRLQTETIRTVDSRIMFDMLTGAFNRNHFLDNMRAAQVAGPIMIIDADHFKAINDQHGHAVGDEALRILANALKQTVGESGIVGRLGGEEFGAFLPGKSEEEGHICADAICSAVRGLHPFIAGHAIHLSVSIGCAYHRPARVIGHSLKQADDLLYRAKAEGRDRALFVPGSPAATQRQRRA
jgi:diguanylate cyclase